MDDFPVDKIQIYGATLASLLHRFSAASGDLHGYLFGHAAVSTSNPLSDHPTTAATASVVTATITSFLSLPSHLPLSQPQSFTTLIGCFSARRKTSLRPSLKDSIASFSLFSSPSLTFAPLNSNISLPPTLFLLMTTPLLDQLIHTHEYKAFQFRGGNGFEPKSLSVVNIGPSFRSQYDCFSPNVQFPLVDCELRRSSDMAEDEVVESLLDIKSNWKDQKKLDMCAEGYEIGRLRKLIGFEASHTDEVENLYGKMLAKLDGFSRLVEQTNAKVLEMENNNMNLRIKLAGLE